MERRVCSSLSQPFFSPVHRRKYVRLISLHFSTIKSVYYVNHNTLTKCFIFWKNERRNMCHQKRTHTQPYTKEERINQMKMFHAVYVRLGAVLFLSKGGFEKFTPAKLMSCGICKIFLLFPHIFFCL